MSTKAVIIALLVALVLGVGAYIALQPAPKPKAAPTVVAAGELVCPIEPGLVNSIELEALDGTVQRIVRGERGGYSLTVGRQSGGGADGPRWPLEEARVSNLLRVLAGARSVEAPDAVAAVDAEASRVTIKQENGKTVHLLLSGRTLTGRGLLKVVEGKEGDRLDLAGLRDAEGKLALVDDTIHNVFRQPGPRAWRDTVAMPGMGPDVSRLRMSNNDLTMRLARLEGKWVVQEPAGAPADAARVSRLIGTLSAMRITSFNDDPGAPPVGVDVSGLNKPLAVIVSETDRRVLHADPSAPVQDGGVTVRTETTELLIGNPADALGQTRYASMGQGGPVVIVSGTGLTRELFDPVEYISRRAVQSLPVDIGMVVIEPTPAPPPQPAAPPTAPVTPPSEPTPGAPAAPAPGAAAPPASAPAAAAAPVAKVFRRDVDKWKEVTGSTEVALDETMAKAMAELLRFLTTEEAVSVALQAPVVWKDEAQLVVGSLSGTPLETVVIGATDGANLGIRTGSTSGAGSVYRWFPRDKVPGMLVTLLPKPTEAVKVPAEVIERDVVK